MDSSQNSNLDNSLASTPGESGAIRLPEHTQLFRQGLMLADQLDLLDIPEQESGSIGLQEEPALEISLSPSGLEEVTVLQTDVAIVAAPLKQAHPTLQSDSQAWAQVWFLRGVSKLKVGNIQGALENFTRALERYPESLAAWVGTGIAHYRMGNFPEAVQAFQQVVAQHPPQSIHYRNLGIALYRTGQLQEAMGAYEQSTQVDPKDNDAYYCLGIVCAHAQDYDRAIAAFESAITLSPQADSYYGLGYVHFLLKDLPAAIAAVGKAKQQDAKYRPIYEYFLKHCMQA